MVKEGGWEPKSKYESYAFDILVRVSESCVMFIMAHMNITKEATWHSRMTQAENISLPDFIKYIEVIIKTL